MANPALLAQIHEASFANARSWSTAEFSELLASPFVFCEGTEASQGQGFFLGREIAGESELLTIAVLPNARGHGIGTDLLARFEAASAARGADIAFLDVAANNCRAIALSTRWLAGNRSAQRVLHPAGWPETGRNPDEQAASLRLSPPKKVQNLAFPPLNIAPPLAL